MSTTAAVLVAFAAFVVVSVAWTHWFGGYAPEPYRRRSCQGAAWKRAFPAASKQEVREFLIGFTECFAFRPSERLQFAPDDTIMGVYRAIYPRLGGVDALELETLALRTERTYGVKLSELWSDRLTFGELFTVCGRVRSEV